jgi:hypothetical protein
LLPDKATNHENHRDLTAQQCLRRNQYGNVPFGLVVIYVNGLCGAHAMIRSIACL